MTETRGSEPRQEPRPHATPESTRPEGRWLGFALLAIVIAFFIGFGWQFYRATTVGQALSAVEHELVVERLRVQLANATLAAQDGRYEAARREMSDFFNRIQTQRAILPRPLVSVGDEFLAMRDDVITGLSRANPEYAGVLRGMLDRFNEAIPVVGAPRPGADATGPAETRDGGATR
jgi:hypothetical protein